MDPAPKGLPTAIGNHRLRCVRSDEPLHLRIVLPMMMPDGLLTGHGLSGSAGFAPAGAASGLVRALREQGPDGTSAQHELAAWVAAHREQMTPPERMVAELKRLLSQQVTPAFPPEDAPELQRSVVHRAIGYFFARDQESRES